MLKVSLIIMIALMVIIAYMVVCRLEDNARKYGTTAKWSYLFWEYKYITNDFGKEK